MTACAATTATATHWREVRLSSQSVTRIELPSVTITILIICMLYVSTSYIYIYMLRKLKSELS